MLARFRGDPLIGNVLGLVAVFVSIGGVSWAVATIDSGDVENNSLKSIDLKDGKGVKDPDVVPNSLSGAAIDESSLGEVPSAASADNATDADSLDSVDSTGFVRVISSTTVQRDYLSINPHQCKSDQISASAAQVGDRVEVRTGFVPEFDVFFLGESVKEVPDLDPSAEPGATITVAQWKYCNLRDTAVDPSGDNVHVTVLRP
jgi:hypothetical protein